MALTAQRAAFFDVDNTLVRGSTLYFLGRGMYQRGFFTKADISRFVVANIRFRMTGTEKKEVIEVLQSKFPDKKFVSATFKELEDIENSVNSLHLPLAFADQQYVLREHIAMVRARIHAQSDASTQPAAELA